MKEIFTIILSIMYAGVGIVGIFGYFPTIKDLYINKKITANLQSYIIWAITFFISLLYAIFILSDLLVIILMGINFLACMIVIYLILSIRKNG